MRLRELFDTPVAYHMSGKDEYSFEIDGTTYRFEYARLNYGFGLSVSFCEVDKETNDCIYTVTDSGNNVKVFATVVEILRKLITELDVKILSFTADEDNRRKLYMRMIKKLIPDWRVYEIPLKNTRSYRVFSPKLSYAEFMELCKKSITAGNMLYIPNEFYTYEMCTELLDANPAFFAHIPTPEQKTDNNWKDTYKKLCLYAINKIGLQLKHIPLQYRDYDICSAAAVKNPTELYFNSIPKDILIRIQAEKT